MICELRNLQVKAGKMNLLGINYFADFKLWKEELEEKYKCSFEVNEEV